MSDTGPVQRQDLDRLVSLLTQILAVLQTISEQLAEPRA